MLQISLFLICIFELLLFSTLRSNAVNIYNLNFTIRFDNYPQEINWTIISLNEGDQVVFSGNGYNATKYETVNDNSLITDGCFKLIIYDSFGDGMFSKQNWGWFTLYLNDTEITLGKQTFDDSQTHLTFCTQLFATNTNTTSNYSNGYNEINITFFNYNSEIIIKDSNNSDTIYYDNVYEIMEQHSTSTTAILIMSDGCYDISFVNSFIDSNDAILHVSVNGSPMITTSTAQSRYLADICLIGWPNWYISTIDYMFDVGVNGNFKSSHKLEIEFEPSYNCGSGSGGGCSYSINTTKKWYINGDCDKGKVAIMIIYKSFSYINLYVNEIYFGQMSNINYDYEYSLNQSDTDYSNGGGYLEIKLQNNNLNAHNIYDSMWLDGFIYVSCDLYPNVTTADPTVNPTHYPTLQPTWDINAADYYWDVASADNEIGVVLFTESQPLTCKKNTTDCEASEMFLIEGECLYPWMSIEVVETDFDASNEFVSIYVNHEYVGMCDALDDECGDELVPCKEGNIYELGDYFNTGANAATDYTNVIVVSLITSDDVNHCNYKGYSLYASVTLGCFNYKNISGNLTNIRICNKTNDCNNQILSDFDIIYCLDSFSCSNITVYNAHSVWCHYNYSCINSHFEKIDFLTCYGTSSCMDSRIDSVNSVTCDGSSSCKNAHFSGVEYDGIKCTTYDSCVNAKGELYTCKGYYDFICPIDEICGYTQELSAYCNVFCYGECFAASETKLKGIPHRKDYLYPLYHICIPWYLYLVYLLPYVLFWLYFDYYFNLYLAEKFNTILLLFDEEFDLLNLGDENISRQNKQENDMHIDLPSVKENHIGRLKCLLYGSEDKNGSAESKWDFIVNQSKLSGKMDKLESRVSAVYNNPNRYFVYSDTYIWSIFCGGGSKYRFKFSYNDIMSAQDDWIHKTKIDVIPTVDVIIPDEIWNIIFDFCRVVYDVIQLNSNENVNLKQLSENEVGLALHFIKYVYLKPQYFDHYAIMCKMLSWYALFEFIKEFVVLICILICFFTSNIKKENWQSYEQFVSILMNFYYGPLNPMFIFYIVHYSFNNLFKCCGIDTITRQHKRLEEVKTKNNNKNNNNNNNNDNNETISISQQYNLSMHQCPSAMKKLLVYYFVKYWMVGLVIVLPFLFVAVLTITCILMWSFCCCKGTTYCVPFLYKKEVQISKIIFYIWMFATVMNSIFCWINIYDGHMWVAAIGRSFLAIDQCPNYFNRNDNYQFDNVFEFIVWLNYWLV